MATVAVLCPTKTNGWYFSNDALGASEWATLNDGLGATDILQGFVDRSQPYTRIVCLLNASRDVYLWNGTTWTRIYTQAQARTLTGYPAFVLRWVTLDPDNAQYIYILGEATGVNGLTALIKSTDNGSTWSLLDVYDPAGGGTVRVAYNVVVRGDVLVVANSFGGAVTHALSYSVNGGSSWADSTYAGDSSWNMYAQASELSDTLYYANGNLPNVVAGPVDLFRLNTGTGAWDKLQDALDLGDEQQPQSMYFNEDTFNTQRKVVGGKLYATTDAWANVVDATPGDLAPTGATVLAYSPNTADETIIGRTTGLTVNDPHHVMLLDAPTNTPLTGISGANAATSPFTDSIPYNAGGVAPGLYAFGADLTSATITGSSNAGNCQTASATLTATYAPTWITDVTYTWSPAPTSGQGTATAVYSTPGMYTVTCTVTGPGNSVQATFALCICGSLKWIVYDRCSSFAGLTALVSTRIYPDSIPENPTYPLVVHHSPVSQDSSQHRRRRSSVVNRTISRVSFDCYATTSKDAESVAREVIAAWDAHTDCSLIGWAYYANRIADGFGVERIFREIVDVFIEHCLVT